MALRKPSAKDQEIGLLKDMVAVLHDQVAEITTQYAGARIELESARHQLKFWHEQSRALENQVAMHQRAHLSTLEAVRNINNEPVHFGELVKRAQAAYDADARMRAGTESLIAAVALTSTRQKDVIAQLMPQLRPLLDQIDHLPGKPPVQLAVGVHADHPPQPPAAVGRSLWLTFGNFLRQR